MDDGPDLPGSLNGGEEIILDLVSDDTKRISVDKSQVREENGHEDGAPQDLVDGDLQGDILCVGSFDLAVEPVVEVVSRWSVVDESKDRECNKSLHVERSSTYEDLKERGDG